MELYELRRASQVRTLEAQRQNSKVKAYNKRSAKSSIDRSFAGGCRS